MRIGVVADTHLPALFRQLDGLGPECAAFLSGVDLVLHAGDVTSASVLDWLEQFAPVVAATGNNDDFCDPRLKPVQYVNALGWRIGMVHDLTPEARPLAEMRAKHFDRPVDVMIAGHTHLERLREEDGLLLVNPGSPILPHHRETRLGTGALLEVEAACIRAEIVVLGETLGRPNPGVAGSLVYSKP